MLLEARDVTKAFGSFKAVDAASVTLEPGDILGLIGPNGAGKSTFFNCLTGDILSTSGTVLFEGHDITNMPPERSEEHTSELQSRVDLVCRLLLEKKKK